MSHDAEGAIKLLQEGLRPERPTTFVQADTIVRTFHVLRYFVSLTNPLNLS